MPYKSVHLIEESGREKERKFHSVSSRLPISYISGIIFPMIPKL